MNEWMKMIISPLAITAAGPVPPGYLIVVRDPATAADAGSQEESEEETSSSSDDVVELRWGGEGRPDVHSGLSANFGLDTGDVADVVHTPSDHIRIGYAFKVVVGDVEVFLLLADF